jgi:hypothetical protein
MGAEWGRLWLALGLIACSAVAGADSVVMLSKMDSTTHLQGYGTPVHVVGKEDLVNTDEVVAKLRQCRALIVERSGSGAAAAFFASPQFCEATRKLLGRGGALFFDYGTNMVSADLITFLDAIDAHNPRYASKATLSSYTPRLTDRGMAIAGGAPNQLTAESLTKYGAYGAWDKAPKTLTVLAQATGSVQGAALLMREGVMTHGRVFYCHITKVWLKHKGDSQTAFQENLLRLLVSKSASDTDAGSQGRKQPGKQR